MLNYVYYKVQIKLGFLQRKIMVKTNRPKMNNHFQENDQIKAMKNLEMSWKRSWKVVEFQKLKGV